MKIHDYIKIQIEENIDLKYLSFHSALVPNIETIKGVRVPILRKIAKQVSKEQGVFSHLDNLSFSSYEEMTIYGLTLGYLKLSLEQYQLYLKNYIPLIDNWATCDVVCSNLKFTRKYLDEMYPFLLPYLKSKKEFEVRFSVVMFLDYYITDSYIDKILKDILKIEHEGYYVKMAVAWLLSICYIKYKEKTLTFLKNEKIDAWTYNKALQKIIESNRVTSLEKEKIRKLKRKL